MSQLAVPAAASVSAPAAHSSLLDELAREALKSAHCVCSGRKPHDAEQPFCTRCLHVLPAQIRANLGTSFRDGFASHYDEALRWLSGHTNRLKVGRR